MRTREEIETCIRPIEQYLEDGSSKGYLSNNGLGIAQVLILEVLLDIRDVLVYGKPKEKPFKLD